ncbi:MAG: hypothetical protein IJ002_07965 [Clostridia bacterium]|nr:hypothetical protein [Clostridia bacterium]
MNVFTEIYYNLKETYFSPDLSAITNFDTYEMQRFMPFLVIGLCAGTFLAVCASYYVSHYLGKVVRALYKLRAFSPKEAKSLDELGLNKPLIRRSLYRDTVVSKYVKPTEPLKSKEDVKTALFYIPEDDRYIADKRFKEVKLGKKLIVITFFVCLFACFGLMLILPDIIQLADNVITMTKG